MSQLAIYVTVLFYGSCTKGKGYRLKIGTMFCSAVYSFCYDISFL